MFSLFVEKTSLHALEEFFNITFRNLFVSFSAFRVAQQRDAIGSSV
jgi:uncharacterized PurR-regulated membrane protein YhhQ (DUF165 family)